MKAAWNDRYRTSRDLKQTFSLPLDNVHNAHQFQERGFVHARSLKNTRMSSRSLWSDLELASSTDKTSRSSRQSARMSQKPSPTRQTRTFSGISSNRQSSAHDSTTKASGASQRLQAILGVDGKHDSKNKGSNERRVTSSAPLQKRLPSSSTRTSRATSAATSSLLPVYDRRESSVYGFGGPMTPPPTSPLPSIPVSDSQHTFRTSSTTPLVLCTPVSPATVSTSASQWSWRLGPDSPGSQLLNDMKTATDISRTRRTGDNILPTKRHIHQRSISSSLASANMLETTVEEDSVRARVADAARRSRKGIDDIDAIALSGGGDLLRQKKTGQLSDRRPVASHQEPSPSATNVSGDEQSDPNATTNSAGSPSSIIKLYMSPSQQSIVTAGSPA